MIVAGTVDIVVPALNVGQAIAVVVIAVIVVYAVVMAILAHGTRR